MHISRHKSANYVSHGISFLAGLLLGGLGIGVAMLVLAPPRTRHIWRLSLRQSSRRPSKAGHLLAFLLHTILDLCDPIYHRLRTHLRVCA